MPFSWWKPATRIEKGAWNYWPALTVVTAVWGPGWLLLSSICLLAFSEVAIINMNSRFTLEKVNVILHAILPMELLWIWVWDSTLFLMLPRAPPWGLPGWQKFQENKPKMQLKEICSGTSREGSQMLHPIPCQPWSLEEQRSNTFRKEGFGTLVRECWSGKQGGVWGWADTDWEWGWALPSHHLKATPWITAFYNSFG